MTPRLAVRAIIVDDGKLLLVNAYPGGVSDLWCAPGGGVEAGTAIPDNLIREVFEETGLGVAPGDLLLVNEFHAPERGFHQVELFFRCSIVAGALDQGWVDPAAVVTARRFFLRAEMSAIRFKPDSLAEVAFGTVAGARYDGLEPMVA